jgi:hypothetical protein
VPADQFAIADFMTVELQAWNSVHDRFQQRLALDEGQRCRVAAVEVQEIKGVKDQARAALPVGRGLGFGEAGKAVGSETGGTVTPAAPTPQRRRLGSAPLTAAS